MRTNPFRMTRKEVEESIRRAFQRTLDRIANGEHPSRFLFILLDEFSLEVLEHDLECAGYVL